MGMNAFCTVVTPSHLCWARALAESLKTAGNFEPLYVLLVSEESFTGSLPDNIHLCALDQLTRSLPKNIHWYFDSFELCNALKPFIVEWVLQQGFEEVCFLDADLYIVGSFDPVWSALADAHLLLTPHHLSPPSLNLCYTNEVSVSDMGMLNGGFLAWRNGDPTTAILNWMCQRFPLYGFCDRPKGMFVDQKLLPLLLQYFPQDVQILHNPCLNIAFWNAHERTVGHKDGRYFVGQDPVVFFHMSGFRLNKPQTPCSYIPTRENEGILAAAPWMHPLLDEYSVLLRSCSEKDRSTPQPFNKFNGIQLTSSLRRILFRKGTLSHRDPEVLKGNALVSQPSNRLKSARS